MTNQQPHYPYRQSIVKSKEIQANASNNIYFNETSTLVRKQDSECNNQIAEAKTNI